jgi:hypothetical protein
MWLLNRLNRAELRSSGARLACELAEAESGASFFRKKRKAELEQASNGRAEAEGGGSGVRNEGVESGVENA